MKSVLITKRQFNIAILSVLLVLAIVGAVSYFGIASIISSTQSKRLLPIYCVDTTEKKIALTFDCAWENSDTLILIDLMKLYNVKATFFATGDFCERYPDDIKLLAKYGHSIQNHSNKHPHVKNIEKQALIDDTTACDNIIKQVTGKKPTLYRAPYGEYSDSMLSIFETDLHHKVIQWDVDSVDWQKPTVQTIVKRITTKVKAGSILLFHNDTKNTPEALAQILPQLKQDGYEFVLVEDLIYKDNYTLDHAGKQIKK